MTPSYTIAELSKMLGLNSTTVSRRSKREDWPFIEESVRGGKRRRFKLEALPPAIRETIAYQQTQSRCQILANAHNTASEPIEIDPETRALAREAVDEILAEEDERRLARQRVKQEGMARFAALDKDSAKYRRAKAREWLLLRAAEYQKEHGGTIEATSEIFARLVNEGAIAIPSRIATFLPKYEGKRDLSAGTLRRWRSNLVNEGIWGLIDGYGNRQGKSAIACNDQLLAVVLHCIVEKPHITSRNIKQYIQANYPDLNIVSERTIARFVSRWIEENKQDYTYLTNPDKWKSVYLSAHGSQSEHVVRLNQLWQMDSTPGDWLLEDGRHTVIGVIDIYSRRLKLLVSPTSKAQSICTLLRQSLMDWGVPERVKTDNGSDYISEQLSTVLRDLEIHHDICIPFASEEKGHVERALETMSHGILDLLPGFIGHNVAERKVIEARKSFAQRVMGKDQTVEVSMSAADLQEKLNQWASYVYDRTPHEGLKGKTPFSVANAWNDPILKIEDERALDALLAPIGGSRTVGKKGIAYRHNTYIAPALTEYINEPVNIRIDESDLGRVYVYTLSGNFVCVAKCPELSGISRREEAAAARHHQKKFVQEKAKELRDLKKHHNRDIAGSILRHQMEESKKVTVLPQRAVSYATPALEEAGKAARADDSAIPASQSEIDHVTEPNSDVAARSKVTQLEETPRSRFLHFVRIWRQCISCDYVADNDDINYLTRTALQTEFQSELGLYIDFGLEVDSTPLEDDIKALAMQTRDQKHQEQFQRRVASVVDLATKKRPT